MVEFLDKHFSHMAGMLTPHNVQEHCPEWFAESQIPVLHVAKA